MSDQKIGEYTIVTELGRGAMGVVYRAQDPKIGRPVAIKVIRVDPGTSLGEGAELRQRLIREASMAGKISHPGIVTVHQLGEEGESVFIVMEYVEGSSLESFLTTSHTLDQAWVVDVLEQIADALDYAHKSNVVHRDVKPANILIRTDGRVKIADFGIAKLTAGAGTALTSAGASIGSPAYMSPEQIQATQIDGKADQFALGTIAFQMLTGRMPFKGDTAHSVMYQIVTGDPFLSQPGDIPLTPHVRDALARALAKHPRDRFADCAAFIKALGTAMGPIAAPPPPPPTTSASSHQPFPPIQPLASQPPPEQKSWLLPAVVGVAAILMLAGGGTYWYMHRTPADSTTSSPDAPPTNPSGLTTPGPAADASPLAKAVASGNVDAVKSLLAKGASADQAEKDGTTPLMLADTAPMVETLVAAGARVDAVDAQGRSALFRDSASGKPDAMRALLDHQANANLKDTANSTPLIQAITHANFEATKLLIDRNADVNLTDGDNSTPLMIAADKSPAEVIKLLLTHGAKRGLKDSKGRIAMQRAAESRNTAALELLR